ncbi:MAG: GNAT family N-acyltransferase [Anaerolineae bacterium]
MIEGAITEQNYREVVDAFAQGAFVMNAPLQFRAAQSPAERDAIYHLRYLEVTTRGWSKPEDYPNQLETDEHDAAAVHVAAWDGETLAGCARLIFPVPDAPLPIETSFDVLIEPRQQVVYLSRVLIAPAYRGKGPQLLLGLLGLSWLEIRARGYSHLCGAFAEAVLPVFKQVGASITPLGLPQEFLGETRYACNIDMLKTAQGLAKHFKPSV